MKKRKENEMRKFLIYLEKLSHAAMEVEAESQEEAEEIAVEKACEDEVDLEWGNSEIISTGSDEVECPETQQNRSRG